MHRYACLALLCVALPLGVLSHAVADESETAHPVHQELLRELADEGIAGVVTWSRSTRTWGVVAADKSQQAAADAVVSGVLTRGVTVLEPATLEDALVILRFEPNNTAALALVRARYADLRQAARKARGGGR